jgi:hypothetical protein
VKPQYHVGALAETESDPPPVSSRLMIASGSWTSIRHWTSDMEQMATIFMRFL